MHGQYVEDDGHVTIWKETPRQKDVRYNNRRRQYQIEQERERITLAFERIVRENTLESFHRFMEFATPFDITGRM